MKDFNLFRERTLNTSALEAVLPSCPFCGLAYDDDAEYVDVGVGCVQVTANVCSDWMGCGAVQQGVAEDIDLSRFEIKGGWFREKNNV